jgi:hypothetical protein
VEDWVRRQEWSNELWVAVWVGAVVLVSFVVSVYENHLKR